MVKLLPIRFTILFIVWAVLVSGCASSRTTEEFKSLPYPKYVCILPGQAPANLSVTMSRPIEVSKNSYGSLGEMPLLIANRARDYKAEVVEDYYAYRSFGFWPWKVIHPFAKGTALRLKNPWEFDCAGNGGKLFSVAPLKRASDLGNAPF